jgi:adenine-specific DNA-methyltransferase
LVFGAAENLGTVVWDKRNPKGDAKRIATQNELIHYSIRDSEKLGAPDAHLVKKKKNAAKILEKAKSMTGNSGRVSDTVRQQFKQWVNNQDFTGGEKPYCLLDDDGDVYRPVSMAWPNKKKAPDEYFEPLIHPITKKPCPVPERGWRNPPPTMQELLDKREILFGSDETTQPTRKYLLKNNLTENLSSLYYFGGSADEDFVALGLSFPDYPKPVEVAADLIFAGASAPTSVVLDFFAGSGTTGHAVVSLNREDKGSRRYLLVEMGAYFDTVLIPRLKKVVYSTDWKEGKPLAPEAGISHAFKIVRLESYEDTLNNLHLRRTPEQEAALAQGGETNRDQYLLGYFLDVESAGSKSLLDLAEFRDPFAYKLNIATSSAGETKETTVDLVETFNWLLGLKVKHIDTAKGFLTVTGDKRVGGRCLILWRTLSTDPKADNASLEKFLTKLAVNPADTEFDFIYVNGPHTLSDPHNKVHLIEETFQRLMFDTTNFETLS